MPHLVEGEGCGLVFPVENGLPGQIHQLELAVVAGGTVVGLEGSRSSLEEVGCRLEVVHHRGSLG